MSVFFEKRKIQDINNDVISKALKLAPITISYLEIKLMEIEYIKTHFLRSGGRECTTSFRI